MRITMSPKETVLVAMSGGVDSSVALIKIIESGYNPIGVTMKLWGYNEVGGSDDNSCCGINEINGAKLVCDQLGVPHYTIDFQNVFKETVIDDFANEYLNGRTPNPCVRCNSYVKWDAFIKQADELGAQYIATGHYATIGSFNNQSVIKKGVDPIKDQSYVLWGIPKDSISRTIFPLGDLTKKQVREIARKHNLETAETPESMEICFVADNNYNRFLNEYIPDKMESIGPGEIIDEENTVVGEHSGYTNYTVGQRKGIGLSYPDPRYVKAIDAETNTITISTKNKLYKNECFISNINWLIKEPGLPINAYAQIRYNSNPVLAKISIESGQAKAIFDKPQLAVTPGQSIVFYNEKNPEILIGGGIIELK
ncbi:MAG: tRNA 2-thiouridine(34) synthase MnmA [Candidatus Marinimicrobia bacterium]|nr:tRNA 2-thiouridine(34) synthase MnmA [Candidatus Neomarinimicrobiota bacterium]